MRQYVYQRRDAQGRREYFDASHYFTPTTRTYLASNYVYNYRGLLQSMTASTNYATTARTAVQYTYTPSGAVATQTLGNAAAQTFAYDVRLRLVAQGDTTGGARPFNASLSYSPASRITSWSQWQGSTGAPLTTPRYKQSMAYDLSGRLLASDYSPWSSSSSAYTLNANGPYDLFGLTYDANGNLLTLQRNGASATQDILTYSYVTGTNRLAYVEDTGNRSAGAATSIFFYTANGALSSTDRFTQTDEINIGYEVNRWGLPAMASWVDPVSGADIGMVYRYSASGERFWVEEENGGSRQMMVLGFGGSSGRESVLGEAVVGATAMTHWNLVTPSGEVVGRIRANGSRRFYWKDHLGSIRAVTDSAGVVYERHDYDAWGSELAGRSVVESVTGRERFTGHAWDAETAWLYAGARLYDPYIGRWMSADPLESKYPGLSPYNYAANMPTMAYDPDGKDFILVVDHARGTVTVRATYLTDPASRAELDRAVGYWNEASGKFGLTISGKSFKLNFELTAESRDDASVALSQASARSADFRENDDSMDPTNGFRSTERDGNGNAGRTTGPNSTLYSGRAITTGGHEVGHTLLAAPNNNHVNNGIMTRDAGVGRTNHVTINDVRSMVSGMNTNNAQQVYRIFVYENESYRRANLRVSSATQMVGDE